MKCSRSQEKPTSILNNICNNILGGRKTTKFHYEAKVNQPIRKICGAAMQISILTLNEMRAMAPFYVHCLLLSDLFRLTQDLYVK